MVGIYKITNLINQKIYIGQSVNIEERWKQHEYKAFNIKEKGYNSAIHAAFRKYGVENFKLDILEECLPEELDSKERYWIETLNSLSPNGYNILAGGQQFRKTKFCPICNKPLSKGSGIRLCRECYCKTMSKDIPSKEELVQKLTELKGNFTKAGLFYNVSDNAVRKWCKKYELPFRSRDYK